MSLPPGVAINQANIGQTIRPSSTALLTIDSEDRFSDYEAKRLSVSGSYNNNPYNFTISRSSAIMNGFFTRLAVTEVVFPTAGLPNINKYTCFMNVIYKIGAAAPVTAEITLNPGFYKPSDLAKAVQAAVRALTTDLSAFTMAYGAANNCFFTYSTNTLNAIAFAPLAYNSSEYPYPSTTRQLFDVMGFRAINQTLFGAAASGFTNAVGMRYVDITCPTLTYNQSLKDTSSQIVNRDSLCRLYLIDYDPQSTVQPSDVNYTPMGTAPTTIYRNFTTPKQIQWSPNQAIGGSLQFVVLDDNGNPLSGVGVTDVTCVDWQMSVLVSEN
jgi:hypothetical protein